MEYWLLYVVVQLLLAAFSYKHFQTVKEEPAQPKQKRVLQSNRHQTQQAVTPLFKQGLKPSKPLSEPLTSGVHMVGGKAVLIKSSATPTPPPPPPSIHSQLNPVKPLLAPVVPVQWGPTPTPRKEGIDLPERVLTKIDRYTYNRDISTRLVMNISQKNPGKDGNWCAEKALWDIERDRQ